MSKFKHLATSPNFAELPRNLDLRTPIDGPRCRRMLIAAGVLRPGALHGPDDLTRFKNVANEPVLRVKISTLREAQAADRPVDSRRWD